MRGFTLIELIFVIVIGGILAFVALNSIPDNTLISDADILQAKILEKRSNALGYKADMENSEDIKFVCIDLNKTSLNNEEKHSKVSYIFKSDISVNLDSDRICFDSLGRPFKDKVDYNLSYLIHKNVIISVKYKLKELNLTLYPMTGFVKVGN